MAHDVFISHSSKDKAVADAVCATMEAAGIRCWIAPRDILPGANWGEAIIDALSTSKAMVLIFSANSNVSGQVVREVERAVSKNIPVVPFRIANVPLSKALEYFLSTAHWLDAFPLYEEHIAVLSQRLLGLIEKDLPNREAARPPSPSVQAEPSRRDTRARNRLLAAGVISLAVCLTIVGVTTSMLGRRSQMERSTRAPASAERIIAGEQAGDSSLASAAEGECVFRDDFSTPMLDAQWGIYGVPRIDAAAGRVIFPDGETYIIDRSRRSRVNPGEIEMTLCLAERDRRVNRGGCFRALLFSSPPGTYGYANGAYQVCWFANGELKINWLWGGIDQETVLTHCPFDAERDYVFSIYYTAESISVSVDGIERLRCAARGGNTEGFMHYGFWGAGAIDSFCMKTGR
jgi:hypothetical protein